jgi:hypothetical protein
MKNKVYKLFVANINSVDIHFSADINAHEYESESVQAIVKHLVLKSGIKAKRKNPSSIKVKVDSIGAKDGVLKSTHYYNYEIMPPLEPMTDTEFEEEKKNILSEVPQEFYGVFASMAWDRGHSSGYEEVISYLKEMVSEFSPAINAFSNRVSKTI